MRETMMQWKKKVNLRYLTMKHWILEDQSGIGVVEVILILVVLIGLVIIFKAQLTSLVGKIFEKITSESSGI